MNFFKLKPAPEQVEALKNLEELRAKALAAVTLLREAVEEWNDDNNLAWQIDEEVDYRSEFADQMSDYQSQLENYEIELETDWPWNLTPWEGDGDAQ